MAKSYWYPKGKGVDLPRRPGSPKGACLSKDRPLTRQQFGLAASQSLKTNWDAVKKAGEVCRWARMHRKLTVRQVADALQCSVSHVYKLQSGGIATFNHYLSFINCLRLDGLALSQFSRGEVPPPDPKQAESMLLEEERDIVPSQRQATLTPPNEPCASTVLIDEVKGVLLQSEWNARRKIGEVCQRVRKFRDLPQASIGRVAKCSIMQVSRLETRGEGRIEVIKQIVSALGLEWATLLDVVEPGELDEEALQSFIRSALER